MYRSVECLLGRVGRLIRKTKVYGNSTQEKYHFPRRQVAFAAKRLPNATYVIRRVAFSRRIEWLPLSILTGATVVCILAPKSRVGILAAARKLRLQWKWSRRRLLLRSADCAKCVWRQNNSRHCCSCAGVA